MKPDEISVNDEEVALLVAALGAMAHRPLCTIQGMAGRGIGVVASEKLFPGDLIMAELPLLVMPGPVFDGEAGASEAWLDRATNRLTCPQRELLHGLTDCRHPGEPTCLGRLYTNSMYWGEDIAVCPVMARTNHSCRPNAEFLPRIGLGVNELRAMYVIEAGEEVAINYMAMAEEGSDVREVRQEYLARLYGFECTCGACSLQDAELAADEAAREEVKELQARGAALWLRHELLLVLLFLAGASTIHGKLSYTLDILEVCQAATPDQALKLDLCLKGLTLALTIFGPASEEAEEWRERLAEVQLWAECHLPHHG